MADQKRYFQSLKNSTRYENDIYSIWETSANQQKSILKNGQKTWRVYSQKRKPKFKKKEMLKLTSDQRNASSNDIKLISTKMAKLEKWVISSISKEIRK